MNDWNSDELRATDGIDHDARLPAEPLELVVTSGPDAGKRHGIDRGVLRVGTGTDCAFVLTDSQVSRRHLQLYATDAGVEISDLDSRNGSFYRGGRFKQIVVGLGATITIGRTQLTVRTVRSAEEGAPAPSSFGDLVGASPSMLQLFGTLSSAARSDATVLLQGETGTGKDLCATALHAASARARAPFVVVDVGAISRTLIESELFGHVRGSFTGADRDRNGAFTDAQGGTLFLDEIGELDRELQPMLLRALERGQVKPIGASRHRSVDVRVIAATHRDLREEMKAGRFREDLFYRLSVVPISIPPLRARRDDIPRLVAHFLGDQDIEVPEESLELLCDYAWPGNVRELRNVLTHATSMLTPDAPRVLAPELFLIARDGAPRALQGDPVEGFREAKSRIIASWEHDYLKQLLARTHGNVSEAARLSGIDRVSLHRVLRRHGLRGGDGT